MSRFEDHNDAFRKLARAVHFQRHFAWGPINASVLLAGVAVTAGLLDWRGELPGDVLLATGISTLILLGLIQLGRRWDVLLTAVLLVAIALELRFPSYGQGPLITGLALAAVASSVLQIASQWDKAILLRLGVFRGLRGPGPFVIAPFIDRIEQLIDQRLRVTDFRAERILTLDTVPVYVDAICFWLVWNAEKAVLEVRDYEEAVILSAQTALKDAVGRHELADLLANRQKLGEEIQAALDEKTSAWGITLQSIEITDVVIPESLEEAMSKRAQAERERQARIILATAETQIAANFTAAAEEYRDNPEALHLRAMNMVYEGIRQHGSMVIVPSSAVESMGLGSLSGIAALAQGRPRQAPATETVPEEPKGVEARPPEEETLP